MNDEQPDPSSRKSWLEKLSFAFSGEPQDKNELIELLRDAQQRNLLDADALAMMEGVMEVAEMRVRDVMIPRSQMVLLQQDWPLEKVLAIAIESGHSRFPVIDDDRDDVTGILIVKDLLRYFAEGGGDLKLHDLLRPAKFIPESKRLNALLKEFRITRLHMAIVVDEYGGVAGLITIEDVLEQIVGEIDDEHDDDNDDDHIRRLGENTYNVHALTPVEDFNAYFGTQFSDDKADTIGGLVMMEIGRLPKRGEIVNIDDFRFRVLRADKRRIHLLELTIIQQEQNLVTSRHAPYG
jgi:magnesium and cobalt transporter